jgi:hypothetical protein
MIKHFIEKVNGMPLAVVFRNRAVKPVCVKTTGDDAPTP